LEQRTHVAGLFEAIPEGEFRVDVSSTQLRALQGS
jgi:hypothetical protein